MIFINDNKYRGDITYFVFSGIIVESEGLNIRSLSVSIKVFGPISNKNVMQEDN